MRHAGHDMVSPSDHLLRTMAAVPVTSQLFELGCGTGRHTEPLLRLGFPLHAVDARVEAVKATRQRVAALTDAATATRCVQQVVLDGFDDYPAHGFDWVIAYRPAAYVQSSSDLAALLQAARRLLKPGGWMYLALAPSSLRPSNGHTAGHAARAATALPDLLAEQAQAADLAASSAPTLVEEADQRLVRGIFRYVTDATPR